jgi:hypothetical protein
MLSNIWSIGVANNEDSEEDKRENKINKRNNIKQK